MDIDSVSNNLPALPIICVVWIYALGGGGGGAEIV